MGQKKQNIKQSVNVLLAYKNGSLTKYQATKKLQELSGLSLNSARMLMDHISHSDGNKKVTDSGNIIPFPQTKSKSSESFES
jgi:hypothetical protein